MIYNRIARAFERFADRPALNGSGQLIDYQTAARRSAVLANAMLRLGQKPREPVIVLLPRSFDQILALIGALRIGATFVPVDVTLPERRLADILGTFEQAIVVTDTDTQKRLASATRKVRWLIAEQIHDDDADVPTTFEAAARDPAYAIFTSGSTGVPKAAVITHEGFANVIDISRQQLGLSPQTVGLQFASLGFDVAIWEIFTVLCSGGELVLIDEEIKLRPARLAASVRENHVNLMFMMASVLDVLDPAAFPTVRRVVTGGESFGPQLVTRWAAADRRLFYVYGPTECAIFQTLHECFAEHPNAPSVGRPLEHVRFHLTQLDADSELYRLGISGRCVGLGYLNQPDLTREKFQLDASGVVVYDTGDIVRLRADGALDFQGRVDRQIKLHGHRIEPAEIERTLERHHGVSTCAVIACPTPAGDTQLRAFIKAASSAESPAQIALWAVDRLPRYMVPAQITVVDAFPLTVNGKIDRTRLTEMYPFQPTQTDIESGRSWSDAERALAQSWSLILGVTAISLESDFFEVGGSSLQALRVIGLLEPQYALRLEHFFSHRTVESIARQMRSVTVGDAPHQNEDFTNAPFPASRGQVSVWLATELHPNPAAYDLPSRFRLTGHVDMALLEKAVDQVCERHQLLKSRFELIDDGLMVVAREEAPTLRIRRFGDIGNADFDWITNTEVRRPLRFSEGELFRAELYSAGNSAYVLGINIHHCISDAWSLRVLVSDIVEVYAGLALGKSSVGAMEGSKYRNWISRQTRLSSTEHAARVTRWRDKLNGRLPLFPVEHSSSDAAGVAAGNLYASVGWNGAGRATGGTPAMTPYAFSLASVCALLRARSDSDDIAIGSVIAGRDSRETFDQIGYFAQTICVRQRVTLEQTFRELVDSVNDELVDILSIGAVSWVDIADSLPSDRFPDKNRIFNVMVTLQDSPIRRLGREGLLIADEIATPPNISLFDLSFIFSQDNDLSLCLNYNVSRIGDTLAGQLVEEYVVLAREALRNPDESLGNIISTALRRDIEEC